MREWMMCVIVSLGACATTEGPLSWQEFAAMAWQEPESGAFITNGDELAEDEAALRAAYERYRAEVDAAGDDGAGDVGEAEQPLVVNRVGGKDDKWPASQARNLTYCVSRASFGARYNAVVSAVEGAAKAWQAVANVRYVHRVDLDDGCGRTADVVFDVRQVSRQSYLARSFFPSSSRSGRELLIDTTAFKNIAPWTLMGILRHELGHTLGFRHEHTRPEAAACFEDNSWRALTRYDSASVMHYPQCNGTDEGDLVLTSLDKKGAAALYP
jgi:hypothetical protein